MTAQYSHTTGVESCHPHRIAIGSDQVIDTLTHLRRCLIRKGDRHNVPRHHMLLLNQISDPVGQRPRFARSGSRQNKNRPLRRKDRLPLFIVQCIVNSVHTLPPFYLFRRKWLPPRGACRNILFSISYFLEGIQCFPFLLFSENNAYPLISGFEYYIICNYSELCEFTANV